MQLEAGVGLGALALVIGFPGVLLAGMWLLGWLEEWMVRPGERAAEVRRVLEEMDEAGEIEQTVAEMLRHVTEQHEVAAGHVRRAPPEAQTAGAR